VEKEKEVNSNSRPLCPLGELELGRGPAARGRAQADQLGGVRAAAGGADQLRDIGSSSHGRAAQTLGAQDCIA
jgi:hypothetical protein